MTLEKTIQIAKQVLDKEINALQLMRDEIGNDFAAAIDMILNVKGRVIVTGVGKSGHVGQKIAATLASTGTPAFFVHPAEASHGDLGMLTAADLIMAISNSGETKELSDILLFCKRFGIPMIAITSRRNSTLGKAANLIVEIPGGARAPEACVLGLAPTTSTTLTLALGDALAVALIEARGFSAADFHARHPGGKLGAFLIKVEDIMAKGDEMPLVLTTMLMHEALLVMTKKNLGCLGVVDKEGKLAGIITDGDLRRHMTADLIVRQAGDIMTKNPKTVPPDMLAVEAVRIMNTTGNGITNIFAVDKDMKPVGLLHIHHCLRAGVV